MSEPFERELPHLRRNRALHALAAAPAALGTLGIFITTLVTGSFIPLALLPQTLMLGTLLLGWVYTRNPRPRLVDVRVEAARAGIRVGDQFVAKSAIKEAFVVPTHERTTVRLVRKGLTVPVEIVVESEAEGREILRALGFDASQTTATFRLPSRALSKPRYSMLAIVLFLTSFYGFAALGAALHMPFLFAILPLVFITFMGAMLWPSRLQVGADGLFLEWLFIKRFIDHGEIDDVQRFIEGFGRSRMTGVKLALKSGEIVKLPVGSPGWDNGRVATVKERIEEARETHRTGRAEADASVLRRGDRSIAEWIAILRNIGAGANAEHRVAPVAPERLWRIVEDPGAGASSRAAAAVALGVSLDDDGRTRLKSAAEATAAPRLRIALESVADPEREAELEASLAELEMIQ